MGYEDKYNGGMLMVKVMVVCLYEDKYNGGMGSNGLTSARHDVFHKYLKEKYPESYDPAVPDDLVYAGNRKLTTDPVEGEN
ncbi:hypothetical protein T484DRAFT_1829415 [Baffinella frigidus]|nr:hypothetical protein T484DRAFT_1829415 [Cryptophyta sp. CCMP2293]